MRKTNHFFVANEMYDKQKYRAKTHNYKKVEYSRQEFLEWLYRDDTYTKLFNVWVESGNDKYLKPSIDRLDATKGYALDNIQVITWGENDQKGKHENLTVKVVMQFDLNGNFIKEWSSAVEVCRELAPQVKNPHKSKIYDVLNKKKSCLTFHGYKFTYKEEHPHA